MTDDFADNLEHVQAAVVQAFEQRFERPPRWAAAAPGRVNLIGEHTDYHEGWVLPMAIDRWVAVAADRAAVGAPTTIRAADLDLAVTADLPGTLRPRPGSFSNHVLGVAERLAAAGHVSPNLDMVVTGTVPIGAGLASSAALEVATATLLARVMGLKLPAQEIALLCREAENVFAGTPCGIMDMLVAVEARAGHALLIDCRSRECRPIPLPPPERLAVLVADSGARHELGSSPYAERRRAGEEAARRLGVRALRDAARGGLGRAGLSGEQRRLARHVIDENERTLLAAAALSTADLDVLGELMFDSHASLRDLYRVSCPELDELVDAAAEARRGGGGVIGARMTGGGFGGCAVVLVDAGAAERVAELLSARFERRFGRRPGAFTTPAVGAARALIRGRPARRAPQSF